MKIDLQTIEELELLKDTGKSLSIFELIDFCLSPGGKYKLKSLFRNTLPDVATIQKHQEAVRFIQKDINLWNLPINKELADKLDVYYFSASSSSLAKNKIVRFIESISYRFIYKDFSKTFVSGTKNLIYFLSALYKFKKVFKDNFPHLLKRYFKEINDFFELPEIGKLLKIESVNKLSNSSFLYYDQLFRKKYKTEVLALIDIVYELDVLIAQAKANIKYALHFPEFINGETAVFEAKELYHLFVKNPVTNDIAYADEQNFIFLTGPNMAGKTTFLKACGIAIFMAHIGMGVPAQSLKISYSDRLFTSLNISDNLPKGYSYFYSEVRRVKEMAEILHQTKHNFIIFDELFKGTNVKDAYEASLQIIKSMCNWQDSLFILSSHLLELGEQLQSQKSIRFLYFDSSIDKGKPIFNYKLKTGLSDERLGMLILENEGVFELLKSN